MHPPDPVLVVDDTLPYREMVESVLSSRGYHVTTAANGKEGLARLRAALGPHVVLLDIVMPLLDGIGLWRVLQADPELREAGHRVILMSSPSRLAAPDVPQTDGQLVKPFTRQDLIAAVAAVQHD
jgi:CheY-like chemotaxis protein